MSKKPKNCITSIEMGKALLLFASFLVRNYGFHTKLGIAIQPTPQNLVEQWKKEMEGI